MPIDPRLLEILACPEDRQSLLYFEPEQFLYNPRLRRRYRIEDDVPVMVVDQAETVDTTVHLEVMALAVSRGLKPNFG